MSSASTDCLTLICRCPSGPWHINCIPSFFCMHTAEHRAINYTGVYLQKEPFPLLINYLLIFSGVTIFHFKATNKHFPTSNSTDLFQLHLLVPGKQSHLHELNYETLKHFSHCFIWRKMWRLSDQSILTELYHGILEWFGWEDHLLHTPCYGQGHPPLPSAFSWLQQAPLWVS